MRILRLEAPFGVFRTFTAGSFRPTAGFITPSAAYGLLLNIAGIEMRYDDGKSVATVIGKELPVVDIALGAVQDLPQQQSLFQQLHNYPVGSSGKEHKAATRGNKYNITPARRSFLSDIHAYIALRGNQELEDQIIEGLQGNEKRSYGLPFLGENNFLIDRLEPVERAEPARWYEQVSEESDDGVRENITRLTITIDRVSMANTRSALFAPTDRFVREIPEKAWVTVGY